MRGARCSMTGEGTNPAGAGTAPNNAGAGTPPAATPQTPATAPGAQQGQVFSEDYVRALRTEAAGYRTRLQPYETAIRQALGLADGTELPADLAGALKGLKAVGDQATLQAAGKAKTALLKGAFSAAAAGRVVDVDDAFALAGQDLADAEVDLESASVKIKAGADGKARTMANLVEALLTRKPHLKAAQAGPGAVGGTTPAGGGGGAEKDEDVAKRIADSRRGAGDKKSFWDRGK